MSDITTQQRIGAQVEAAGKVRTKEAEFQNLIRQVVDRHQGLASGYKGQGASALNYLVNSWAQDASRLVREFEGFASRLVQTDRMTASSQDEQSSQFKRAETPFRTSI